MFYLHLNVDNMMLIQGCGSGTCTFSQKLASVGYSRNCCESAVLHACVVAVAAQPVPEQKEERTTVSGFIPALNAGNPSPQVSRHREASTLSPVQLKRFQSTCLSIPDREVLQKS